MTTPNTNEFWFYEDNGQAQGPVSTAEMIELIQSNRLSGLDLAMKQGALNWKAISDIAEFKALVSKATLQSDLQDEHDVNQLVQKPLWIVRPQGDLKQRGLRTQEGPFQDEDVKQKIKQQVFLPTDLIWKPGLADWTLLRDVKEFGLRSPQASAPRGDVPLNVASQDVTVVQAGRLNLTSDTDSERTQILKPQPLHMKSDELEKTQVLVQRQKKSESLDRTVIMRPLNASHGKADKESKGADSRVPSSMMRSTDFWLRLGVMGFSIFAAVFLSTFALNYFFRTESSPELVGEADRQENETIVTAPSPQISVPTKNTSAESTGNDSVVEPPAPLSVVELPPPPAMVQPSVIAPAKKAPPPVRPAPAATGRSQQVQSALITPQVKSPNGKLDIKASVFRFEDEKQKTFLFVSGLRRLVADPLVKNQKKSANQKTTIKNWIKSFAAAGQDLITLKLLNTSSNSEMPLYLERIWGEPFKLYQSILIRFQRSREGMNFNDSRPDLRRLEALLLKTENELQTVSFTP